MNKSARFGSALVGVTSLIAVIAEAVVTFSPVTGRLGSVFSGVLLELGLALAANLFTAIVVRQTSRSFTENFEKLAGVIKENLIIGGKGANAPASIMGLMLREETAKRNVLTVVLASAIAVYLLIRILFSVDLPIAVPVTVLAIIALVWLNHRNLLNRMLSGRYGSTEQDAREIVRFLLVNADEHDGAGGRRKISLSEAEVVAYVKEVKAKLGLREAAA